MKRLLLISVFLCSLSFQAQFNEDAPWMESIKTKKAKSSTPVTFNEMVTAFDAYWETRDPNVRGSGYKPFKRWENHWKNYVKVFQELSSQRKFSYELNYLQTIALLETIGIKL
mgnify:CR=1 FL=1